jgi:hypothetical protein
MKTQTKTNKNKQKQIIVLKATQENARVFQKQLARFIAPMVDKKTGRQNFARMVPKANGCLGGLGFNPTEDTEHKGGFGQKLTFSQSFFGVSLGYSASSETKYVKGDYAFFAGLLVTTTAKRQPVESFDVFRFSELLKKYAKGGKFSMDSYDFEIEALP